MCIRQNGFLVREIWREFESRSHQFFSFHFFSFSPLKFNDSSALKAVGSRRM